MKKKLTGKILGVFLIAAIILGSTAILGFAMAASQNAAGKEVVSRSLSYNAEPDYDIPIATPTATPYDPNPPTLSPEKEAIAVSHVVMELERIFSVEISDYDYKAHYMEFITWDGSKGAELAVTIINDNNGYLGIYDCISDAVIDARIYDQTKIAEGAPEFARSEGPTPGDNSYNEAAIRSASIINNEAIVQDVFYFDNGYNGTDIYYRMAVSLTDGNAYLIYITKEDRSFAGYSVIPAEAFFSS